MNELFRYCSTQAARLTSPLVVVGMDPGGTRTRSAGLRPCAVDNADVTSALTVLKRGLVSAQKGGRGFQDFPKLTATRFIPYTTGRTTT